MSDDQYNPHRDENYRWRWKEVRKEVLIKKVLIKEVLITFFIVVIIEVIVRRETSLK